MTDIDHTRINIEFDPRVQRMRGTAVHGNASFDVPYVSHIADRLWMGGCKYGLELPPNIGHVVSLYPWEEYTTTSPIGSFLQVRMYDDLEGPDVDEVEAIARWVNRCRTKGETLVHCQAGLNRSGLITATALILEGMPMEDAIALLREKRSPAVLCNPSFVGWLRKNYS